MRAVRLRSAAIAAAVLVSLPAAVRAQPEIVPAEHPVYDFLHAQRVAGRLGAFDSETRPLPRHAIRQALAALDSLDLPRGVRAWRETYRREFFEPEASVEAIFGKGRVRLPHGRDTEKYVFFQQDREWRLAVEVRGLASYRAARDSMRVSAPSIAGEVAISGNYRGLVGFTSETFNGATKGGPRVLLRDPETAPLYYPQTQPDAGQFDRTTASVRVGRGRVFAEIANARLRFGSGPSESLIFGSAADYVPHVRVGAGARRVQYTYLHGSLGDRARYPLGDSVPGSGRPPQGIVASGNARYLALHRVDVRPIPALSLAFTEMVVYGRRGVELAYLNPAYPFRTAEHALYDRDNSLFALDASARPLRGVELYGTVLVDDFNFGLIGRRAYSNKWAIQGGASASRGDAMGWIGYTRVEPFTYTHRFFAGGSYYNAYTQNGFALGHPLGPNADEWEAGLRLWAPARITAEVRARYRRRAEGFTGSDGVYVNVGGDLSDGAQPSFDERSKIFLRGIRHDGPGAALALTFEPVRDALRLALSADTQRWTGGDPTQTFVRFDVRFVL